MVKPLRRCQRHGQRSALSVPLVCQRHNPDYKTNYRDVALNVLFAFDGELSGAHSLVINGRKGRNCHMMSIKESLELKITMLNSIFVRQNLKTKLKSTSNIFVGVSILLFMLPAFGALEIKAAEKGDTYWVSTNTDSADLGTLDNPYICNTQSNFDYRMNSLPANSTIHILAGTYQTKGLFGWYVKTGQKIIGSGIDITIIQLITNAPSNDAVIASHFGTNMVVSDLTVDANYISGNYTYYGVVLNGTKSTISRVKAINMAYFDTTVNSESWGIVIQSYGYGSTIQSEGNLIEDCEVSQFQGGNISAIAFNGSPTNGISGIMRGNRVYLPTNQPFGIQAFNGGWTHNWLVEGNFVHGGGAGFYGDTGSYSNVVVAHNLFENCYFGVELGGGNRENLAFIFNTILLNPSMNTYYHNDAFYFCNTSGFTYTNIIISGNAVDFAGATISGMTYNFLDAITVSGLTVGKNTVNSVLVNHFSGCNAIKIQKNFDLNGNVLTNFDQGISNN
jgi:hypothetical protein